MPSMPSQGEDWQPLRSSMGLMGRSYPYVKAHGPRLNLVDGVQRTLTDATSAKFRASAMGYYIDNYIRFFASEEKPTSPLMNRGYYSRVKALRHTLYHFLDFAPPGKTQILSIGAGFDTTFWHLSELMDAARSLETTYDRNLKFFELDFGVIAQEKAQVIQANPELRNRCGNIRVNSSSCDFSNTTSGLVLDSDFYSLLHFDLNGQDFNALESILLQCGFDPSLPTALLSECCLVYLTPQIGDAFIQWAASFTKGYAQMIVYEQIKPEDPYGIQMCGHLKNRGCELKSVHEYPNREAIHQRFVRLGWTDTILDSIRDMNFVFDDFLPKSDILRITSLEFLDELEEWRLIQGHYAISVAIKGPSSLSLSNTATPDAGTVASYIENLRSVFCNLSSVQVPHFSGEQARQLGYIRLSQVAAQTCADQEAQAEARSFRVSAAGAERRARGGIHAVPILGGMERTYAPSQ